LPSILYEHWGETGGGLGRGAPGRRSPTGVRERSPRALRRFYSLFLKYEFSGIFWLKFLLKNSFFICLN